MVLDGSRKMLLLSGVLQGSDLESLLFFVFYKQNIAVHASSRVRLYADDCCIYFDIFREDDSQFFKGDLHSGLP